MCLLGEAEKGRHPKSISYLQYFYVIYTDIF